jgi:hypothetical protein
MVSLKIAGMPGTPSVIFCAAPRPGARENANAAHAAQIPRNFAKVLDLMVTPPLMVEPLVTC